MSTYRALISAQMWIQIASQLKFSSFYTSGCVWWKFLLWEKFGRNRLGSGERSKCVVDVKKFAVFYLIRRDSKKFPYLVDRRKFAEISTDKIALAIVSPRFMHKENRDRK